MDLLTTPELVEKWKEFFEPSEEVVDHHILWEQFKERQSLHAKMTKLIFYIANFKAFGNPHLKSADGNLWYKLTVKLEDQLK